jgi:hypothetical protein
MRRIAADDQDGTMGTQIVLTYARAVRSGSNINDTWREFAERILRPLFDYLDERVGTESSVLYTLERYVRRVEWFERDELHQRYLANRQNGEGVYNLDLRKFLFSEGINMPFSEAKSASGSLMSSQISTPTIRSLVRSSSLTATTTGSANSPPA